MDTSGSVTTMDPCITCEADMGASYLASNPASATRLPSAETSASAVTITSTDIVKPIPATENMGYGRTEAIKIQDL